MTHDGDHQSVKEGPFAVHYVNLFARSGPTPAGVLVDFIGGGAPSAQGTFHTGNVSAGSAPILGSFWACLTTE
jgi:hypothetical protein